MSNPNHHDSCNCQCDILENAIMDRIKNADYLAGQYKLAGLEGSYEEQTKIRNVLLSILNKAGYNLFEVGEWLV